MHDRVAGRSQDSLGFEREMVVLGCTLCRSGATIAAHNSHALGRSQFDRNRRDGIRDPWICDGLRVRISRGEDIYEEYLPQMICSKRRNAVRYRLKHHNWADSSTRCRTRLGGLPLDPVR